ncbi:hypothetical protein DND132_1950 [Pseudodesulfovibrio mercurii]|uniref:Uncharacterized protein n=1 Tax=Pseudodesulfovibrio mercurii TaxID=641491 RepID=F0JGW6_9BACT|nr:hypothetical protein [Pseudodesulfovibrio mercurii]EGB15156.1 hypothetical protein DND132_1950 [Pseudodesulfovibrio mercurii]
MVTLTPVTDCRTVLVLRAGPAHREYGDPYEVAATIILKRGAAYVMGMSGCFQRAYLTEGALILRARFGVRRLEWERRHGKRINRVTMALAS